MKQHRNGNRNHKVMSRNEERFYRTLMRWKAFMKLRTSLLALLFVFAADNAFAHGDKVHVSGTVEKIRADSMVVKTGGGKSVEVKFGASTVFLSRANNEDKPAKAGDLAAGDLVVIHATPKGNTLEADEIKFSVPPASKPAMPPRAKPKS